MPSNIVFNFGDHQTWLQTVLPIASTTIAAGAALASWLSVRLARRSQVDADRPQLAWYIRSIDTAHPLTLSIENVGRGVAILPGFVILAAEGKKVSYVLDRNLAHGDKERFGLPFMTGTGAAGIAFCEDRDNNVHLWSAERKYQLCKPSKRRNLTLGRMLEAMYPGRGADLEAAQVAVAQPIKD